MYCDRIDNSCKTQTCYGLLFNLAASFPRFICYENDHSEIIKNLLHVVQLVKEDPDFILETRQKNISSYVACCFLHIPLYRMILEN